jgi:hypothetical protein
MKTAFWKPGRRLFSSAAALMAVMAVGHTVGILGGPADAEQTRLFADMNALHVDLGMGMAPSVNDIYEGFAWTATITFAGLGLINVIIAAIPETPYRVLRGVAWVDVVWVGAFGILSWIVRIPPPILFAAFIEALLGAWLLRGYDESA